MNASTALWHGAKRIGMFAVALSLALTCVGAGAGPIAYTYTNVVDTRGEFGFVRGDPAINNSGTVVFFGQLDAGVQGIFTSAGGAITTIASTAGGTFAGSHFGIPSINNLGTVAFRGAEIISGTNVRGIFTANGGTVSRVRTDPFVQADLYINDAGRVAFQSGSGISTFNPGGPLTGIVAASGATLGSINNSGIVAFQGPGLPGFGSGIFVSSGGPVSTIAATGGSFSQFAPRPAINDAGSVAFQAQLAGGGQGIFVGNGERLRPSIADSSGSFKVFQTPSINNLGVVAYTAFSGPSSAHGLFLAVPSRAR